MAAQEDTFDDNVRSFKGKNRDRNDEQQEKPLPFNEEAEQGVLGSMAQSPTAAARVIDGVRLHTEHFYREIHRELYRAAVALYSRDKPVDLLMLHDELQRTGKLEAAGGRAYVSSLANCVPTDENVEYYAEIVKRDAIKRKIIEQAGHIAAAGYDGSLGTDDLLKAVERIYQEIPPRADSAPDDLFPVLSDREAEEIPAARGIVGDILYEDSLAILYGPSGRWKSFLALAWSLCIATGKRWFGRDVTQGHVFYIAAEGGRGIGRRVAAWKRHHGVADASYFHLIPVPVDLLSPEHIDKLIRTIERLSDGAPALIVIDTLSRSMPGADENTGKDGSRAIAAADALRRAFERVTILMVAHPGKNEANGIRGWSGYFQWADTVVNVKCCDNKPRLDCGDVVTLASEKPKENEPFEDISFTAQRVEWTAESGASLNSLVLVAAERVKFSPTPSPKRRALWEVISEHAPITYAPLWAEVSALNLMSESTMNKHLKEMLADGQIVKNAFGAYDCPKESAESSKTA